MKYLLISMLVLSCATTNPADAAQNSGSNEIAEQSTRSASSSLVAGKSWTLKFTNGCVLMGRDDEAHVAKCPTLDRMYLDGEVSKKFGEKVSTLKMNGDNPAVGGVPFATLSHSGATYNIDVGQTRRFSAEVEYELYKRRVAEREERLKSAAPCAEGEVVLQHNLCPDTGGPSVCGRPVTTCGAPLKVGETCWFNASCESGDCSLSNVCQ